MADDVAAGAQDGGPGVADAARHLRRSEERFRLLVDSVVDYAIFILDPHGVIDSWNAGAARVKGYAEHEIVGQHHSVFYPPESREAGLPRQLLDAALEHGRTEHTGWRVRKDGSRFWADVVITALFDDDGTHTGFAKVTRDRTEAHRIEVERERVLEEQRRAVARLEELDAWRREFIGAVVHDLQTPVAAIGGFARLLREGDLGEDELVSLSEGVLANTGSLQELIDNLRDYTSLTEPQRPLTPEPIELDAFVGRLVAASAPLLGERRVETELDDLQVEADRHGLERILRNLFTNVARHTPPDTTVVVRAQVNGPRTVLEVEDDGDGIAPEVLPSIFDRFEHGGKGGTGLGLAIAKGYAELHGGTISVDSVLGEGATFRLTLPTHHRGSGDGQQGR